MDKIELSYWLVHRLDSFELSHWTNSTFPLKYERQTDDILKDDISVRQMSEFTLRFWLDPTPPRVRAGMA